MADRIHRAFIVLAPGGTSSSTRSEEGYTLTIGIVDSVDAAVRLISSLGGQGLTHVELSEAFGDEGLAAVEKALDENVKIGRVRFHGQGADAGGRTGDMSCVSGTADRSVSDK